MTANHEQYCWACHKEVHTPLEVSRRECFRCFAEKDGPYYEMEAQEDDD